MPDSLPDLEARRSQLLLAIAQLGDFRRGSVHASFRRCGKPNCACASDDHPGHGPQVRLSYKLRGKTVHKTLSDPVQLRKAEREVAAFRRFQQLSAELVEVNERICQLRPPQMQDLEQLPQVPQKTLRAIQAAVQAEVGSLLRVIANARRKVGAFDLEAREQATRAALHRAGARLLEELLEETEDEGQPPLCTCGSPMRCEGPRPKRLVSLLGVVSLRRPYYHCRHWTGRSLLSQSSARATSRNSSLAPCGPPARRDGPRPLSDGVRGSEGLASVASLLPLGPRCRPSPNTLPLPSLSLSNIKAFRD